MTYLQAWVATIYFISTVDKETIVCLFLIQLNIPLNNKNMYLLVDILLSISLFQLESIITLYIHPVWITWDVILISNGLSIITS
jgi:hypothetical protein